VRAHERERERERDCVWREIGREYDLSRLGVIRKKVQKSEHGRQ